MKGAPDAIMSRIGGGGKYRAMKAEWEALMATGKRVIMFAKHDLTLNVAAGDSAGVGYTFEGTSIEDLRIKAPQAAGGATYSLEPHQFT